MAARLEGIGPATRSSLLALKGFLDKPKTDSCGTSFDPTFALGGQAKSLPNKMIVNAITR